MITNSRKSFHITIAKKDAIQLSAEQMSKLSPIACDSHSKFIRLPNVCFRVDNLRASPEPDGLRKKGGGQLKAARLPVLTPRTSRSMDPSNSKWFPNMIYLNPGPLVTAKQTKSCNVLLNNLSSVRIADQEAAVASAASVAPEAPVSGKLKQQLTTGSFRWERMNDDAIRQQFLLMRRESLQRMRQLLDQEIRFKTPIFEQPDSDGKPEPGPLHVDGKRVAKVKPGSRNVFR